ncbi:MAG: potassium-transporting ATPase subunit KdpC [Methanomicrobiales archaeon]|nr:potassium-transporting ATPase subunit KdpC [Methanomicrobiales archaeon]
MHVPLKTCLLVFITLFVITGVLYPLAVTVFAELAFPVTAHGSILRDERGRVLGSSLIGQNFSAPRYFTGRLSATGGTPYNPAQSGGSNLGPTNPVLIQRINTSVQLLRLQGTRGAIPADLVTASASGVDPHLSLESALLQVPAIARERNLREEDLRALVLSQVVSDPIPGHPPYVNVLLLNRALDQQTGR